MIGAVLLLPTAALAVSDASGGTVYYDMIFGTAKGRNAARSASQGVTVANESCDVYDVFLGSVNGFFCHLEKDLGVTGVGKATKNLQSMTIHAEVNATAITINGVAYTGQGWVWICQTASCTNLTQFNRAYFIAFTFDKANGINKGYVLQDPGAVTSQAAGGAMEIIYDVGSASATQTVKLRAIQSQGGGTYAMRAVGSKTSTLFDLNLAIYNSGVGGIRFAMAGTPPSASGGSSNTYSMFYEYGSGGGTGMTASDGSGITNPPAISGGFCVSASESGATMTTTGTSSSACSSYSFSAFDYFANTASGTPSVQALTASGILGTWQGMAANPSAL